MSAHDHTSRMARDAALAGGRVLASRLRDHGDVRSKAWSTDLVTEADIQSGIAVVESILSRDPHARILVEEPEVHASTGVERASLEEPLVWVVDPLDGTTSFVHGYPCFSVAVALLRDAQPVAGAVYNVALDEMCWAATGTGAHRDSELITASSAESVSEALLVTGFPYDRGEPLDVQLAVLKAFLRTPVHGIRRDGSAAIDCCHVASGRCDGFWEYGLKPWDMAAGVLLCREAGAVATDVDGAPWTAFSDSICVANPVLHREMLSVIHSAQGTSRT